MAQSGPTVSARQRTPSCLARGVTCRRPSSSEGDGFLSAVRSIADDVKGGQTNTIDGGQDEDQKSGRTSAATARRRQRLVGWARSPERKRDLGRTRELE